MKELLNNFGAIIGAIAGLIYAIDKYHHGRKSDEIAKQKADDDHDKLVTELSDSLLVNFKDQIADYKKQLADLTAKAEQESLLKDQQIAVLTKENHELKQKLGIEE